MTKLSQIVAVEKGVKSTANRAFTDSYHRIQQPALFEGQRRTYQPRRDGDEGLPPETTKVQRTVADELDELGESLTRLFDIFATKDVANTKAKANVVVDGVTLIEDAPPTLLLSLEKYLGDVKAYVAKLPVLDPSVDWTEDHAESLWRSNEVTTVRTRKEPRVVVKYDATDKHPAQTELLMEDRPIGDYHAVRFSGAISKTRRDELAERVDTLIQAVRFAREEANSTQVEDVRIGKRIVDYLFD